MVVVIVVFNFVFVVVVVIAIDEIFVIRLDLYARRRVFALINFADFLLQHRTGFDVINNFQLFGATNRFDLHLSRAGFDLDSCIAQSRQIADHGVR